MHWCTQVKSLQGKRKIVGLVPELHDQMKETISMILTGVDKVWEQGALLPGNDKKN